MVLILLSLAVVLTLILYILSRSVTDVLVSSKSEETSRAFSAAEAGIERALIAGVGSSDVGLGNNAGYTSSVSSYANGATKFNYLNEIVSGESFTLWFVNHNPTSGGIVCDVANPCFTGDTIKICWGKPGTPADVDTTPAIEMSIFYHTTPSDAATISIGRITADPNASRRASNGFGTVGGTCTIDGTQYQFSKGFTFSSMENAIPSSVTGVQGGLRFARIKMIYNTDKGYFAGVDAEYPGNSTLPSQGQLVESTGTSGESLRKVRVVQSWPEPPLPFDYVVFSPGSGISK